MFQYNLLKRRFSQNKILRIITVLKDKVFKFSKGNNVTMYVHGNCEFK